MPLPEFGNSSRSLPTATTTSAKPLPARSPTARLVAFGALNCITLPQLGIGTQLLPSASLPGGMSESAMPSRTATSRMPRIASQPASASTSHGTTPRIAAMLARACKPLPPRSAPSGDVVAIAAASRMRGRRRRTACGGRDTAYGVRPSAYGMRFTATAFGFSAHARTAGRSSPRRRSAHAAAPSRQRRERNGNGLGRGVRGCGA